jgi:hypothetical protein
MELPSGTERSRTRMSAETAGESVAGKPFHSTAETMRLHIDDDGLSSRRLPIFS